MDTLIDELFLFSKLDLNRVPFQFETVECKYVYARINRRDADGFK